MPAFYQYTLLSALIKYQSKKLPILGRIVYGPASSLVSMLSEDLRYSHKPLEVMKSKDTYYGAI